MAETIPCKSERKRERQPISVPFIWEEKPGMPKKDWKPMAPPSNPAPAAPLPVKLLVSVPFEWEEKPGTPLPTFVQPQKELDHGYGNNDDQGEKEGDGSSDLEIDAYSYESHDSFSSAKSLLANALISTTAISSAVPVHQASLALTTMDGEQLQSPGSPASETESISSYTTGTTSLVGASFLEWLFPLLVPNSGVPRYSEKYPSQRVDVEVNEFLQETNSSQVGKPLLTLGELIVMSRRRSCQRKVMKMHKQQSMDFMKRKVFGCCISGIGNGINGLPMKWKRQLQLKLM